MSWPHLKLCHNGGIGEDALAAANHNWHDVLDGPQEGLRSLKPRIIRI